MCVLPSRMWNILLLLLNLNLVCILPRKSDAVSFRDYIVWVPHPPATNLILAVLRKVTFLIAESLPSP